MKIFYILKYFFCIDNFSYILFAYVEVFYEYRIIVDTMIEYCNLEYF